VEEHEQGREAFESDDAFNLHRLRHSAAHVMAEAITILFPGAKLGIGPAIEDGFYYDVDVSRPITEDDLGAIEAQMKKIRKRNSRFERTVLSRADALEKFAAEGQDYKVELINGLDEDADITVYDQGGFTDLCRGPHVGRTGNVKHVKLLKVSGAYWRGDAAGAQLQRVYGTVWKTRDELDKYLFRIEEAKKRDHRRVGRDLDLFMFHEWAPGVPFFLPKGEAIYHELSEAMRTRLLGDGYLAVRTPMLFDSKLWKTSGHWDHYSDAMFSFTEDEEPPAESEGCDHDHEPQAMGLKPMNCPSHMLIFRSKKRSYRDLPMRIADQGVLHRNELRGALGGLTRVRQFAQDDGHLFVMEEQIEAEITDLLNLVQEVYGAFGLGCAISLATRPEKKLGSDERWDTAESALRGALDAAGVEYGINEGDGAFYGPKIDFEVVDALGRKWQCATVQLDYQLPERFDLTYVGADNTAHRPVVIHRAIFGSLERFMAILIEHFAGDFPVWLAPEQVRILTVSEKSVSWGQEATDALVAAGVRVHFDDRDHKIGLKIRESHGTKTPYVAVVGERDMENKTVSVKSRKDGDLGALDLAAFVERVAGELASPF
jgi:threonyl-tRNA synthetase